jgi:catechol 2,3-dioxygenase-like lactoylglutathione lyase family enzyme
MKPNVKRIVINIETDNLNAAKEFYSDLLGLEVLMDQGWIATYGNQAEAKVQISFATEGGSGTPVPDISIEVDDVDSIYEKMKASGIKIEYEITDEAWGVRRFFARDPFGKLVNILSHL